MPPFSVDISSHVLVPVNTNVPRKSIDPPKLKVSAVAPGQSRYSLYQRGRLSSGHALSAVSLTSRSDPRPLSDKSWIKEQTEKVKEFLIGHGYTGNVWKAGSTPSTKDFKAMFLTLIRVTDSNYQYQQQGDVDEEIVKFIKLSRYPFTITKSALQAAGTPHSWPALLGLMSWLVDQLKYREFIEMERKQHNTFNRDQAFISLLSTTYPAFLNHDDQALQQADEQMKQSFADRDDLVIKKLMEQEAILNTVNTQLASHSSQTRTVHTLTSKKLNVQDDVVKFVVLLEKEQQHLRALEKRVEAKRIQEEQLHQQIIQLQHDKESMLQQINTQQYTQLQVATMTHQQQMLAESFAELEQQKKKLCLDTADIERLIQKKLNDMHVTVSEFNKAAANSTTHDLPELSINTDPQDVTEEHVVQTTAAASSAKHIQDTFLICPDLNSNVKPLLASVYAKLTEQLTALSATVRTAHDEWFSLTEQHREDADKLAECEARLVKKEEAFRTTRTEMNAELSQLVNQVEETENALNLLDSHNKQIAEMKSRGDHEVEELQAEKERCIQVMAAEECRQQRELSGFIQEIQQHQHKIHQTVQAIQQQAESTRQILVQEAVLTP